MKRPQVSLLMLILLMNVFIVMSVAMLYASRVGAVQDEMTVFGVSGSSGQSNRTAHLTFLMFTYSSPLLLAMVGGVIVTYIRYRNRQVITRRTSVVTRSSAAVDN